MDSNGVLARRREWAFDGRLYGIDVSITIARTALASDDTYSFEGKKKLSSGLRGQISFYLLLFLDMC